MKDQDKIDYLVEQHGLDRENMEPLEGTNCLGQIYEWYSATANADEDGDGDETSTDESDGTGHSGNGGVSDTNADPDDTDESVLDQIMSRLDELEAANEHLHEQVNKPVRAQQEAAAEQLADELGIEADAINVDADAADTILARANERSSEGYSYEAEQEQRMRANMAGVAGEVTRSNADDTEGYVTGVQRGDDRFRTGGD